MAMIKQDEFVYQRKENLKSRPFEPWHAVVVYTPDTPALHWLNAMAWLVLEACDGRTVNEIIEVIADALPRDRAVAEQSVERCLADLEQKGLIQRRKVV